MMGLFSSRTPQPPKLMVTLWPDMKDFPHFPRFAADTRLAGIRLNSAMITKPELDSGLELVSSLTPQVPLYFDVKGRQLRIAEVLTDQGSRDNPAPPPLQLLLNHPIRAKTPSTVLFKAGADDARLLSIEDDGYRLVFEGGPRYKVRAGESLHIRNAGLQVMGPQFAELELEKIATVRKAGFTRWFLSYVEGKRDVDEFLSLVGRDAEVMLKIENQKGLDYVARGFKKRENLRLVAARGDLYIELARPHEIPTAMRTIISKDPDACVGSRILLSVVQEPILEAFNMLIRKDPDAAVKARDLLAATQRPGVPSCADFQELAGLYDIGFRTFMLCDELCLKERLLATAVNAFEAFRKDYVR